MNRRPRIRLGADEALWRRLTAPEWIVPLNGRKRVSSAAFKGHKLDLELSTHATRLTALEWVFDSRPYAFGVGQILVGQALVLGLAVDHDPEPDDHSHTVIRLNNSKSKRLKHAKSLALKARLTERPPAPLRDAEE